MRYFFSENGLVPIEMSDDALLTYLCDCKGGVAATLHAKWCLAKLLDDEKTVFRNPATHSKNDIFGIITSLGRINLQATLVFGTTFEETMRESQSGRVILDITFGGGYDSYTSNVSLLDQTFLSTLIRKAMIDDMLIDL